MAVCLHVLILKRERISACAVENKPKEVDSTSCHRDNEIGWNEYGIWELMFEDSNQVENRRKQK